MEKKEMMQLMLEVLLLLGSLQLQPQAAASTYPMAKSNCNNTCGNITFPFPFGIGPGCFLDDWYEIVCEVNNTVSKLKKLDLQVLNISLPARYYGDDAAVIVNYPVVHSNLSCTRNKSRGLVDLYGSPYLLSSSLNTFVAAGCDNIATLESDENPSFLGCRTRCTGSNTSRYSSCNGFDCCQSTISSDLQGFSVNFQTENNMRTGYSVVNHDCQFAFLVYNDWFLQANLTDLHALRDGDYVPVALQWGILNASLPRSLGIKINPNFSSYDVPSVCWTSSYLINNAMPFISCSCNRGYDGNPYLPDGCRDINECENSFNGTKMCAPRRCRNMPGSYECVKGKRTGLFIVIGLCSSFGSLLLIFLAWLAYKLIKKRKETKLKEKFFKRNGGLILQQRLFSVEDNIEKSKLFDTKELEKATDNFNKDRVLGKGGQGTVYKGMLTDGRIVAIKKSLAIEEENVEPFINEIVILSQINHRNVVKILGCCLESEVPLLVYEFIPNGTLYQYLHDHESPVSWSARLRIATEIAGALYYLHSSASIPIYHRDIKSSNILLDEKYRAKIADFGTSRTIALDQTHVTTLVQGTFGYLDPEYFQSSQFTNKSDVYSFGVVLVELLTGQKPVSSIRANEGRSLAMYFIISMEENHLFDVLDGPVKEQGREEEIIAVANLAKRCLNLKGRKRPAMKEVMIELEGIKNPAEQNQEKCNRTEAETSRAINAWSVSKGSEMDADVISLPDVLPLLPSGTW